MQMLEGGAPALAHRADAALHLTHGLRPCATCPPPPPCSITQVDMVWQANADDINTQTYCAYRQARAGRGRAGKARPITPGQNRLTTDPLHGGQPREVPASTVLSRARALPPPQARCDGTPSLQAWDFSGTSATALSMRLWYNATLRGRDGPPTILRVNQVGPRAVQTGAAAGHRLQQQRAWLAGLAAEAPGPGAVASLPRRPAPTRPSSSGPALAPACPLSSRRRA